MTSPALDLRASADGTKSAAAGPEAWSRFWQKFGPADRPHERCYVPADGRQAVDRHWLGFAAELSRGARVLDLGCGAGILGRTLLCGRPDLQVIGIDWARVPSRREKNLTIHPHTSMEALPFGEDSFDAAASLFGIEYGRIVDAARELDRVAKRGARFSFLIHHRESRIVREGGARRRALRELISGAMKGAFLSSSAAGVDQQRQRLAREFPGEPMVKLVSDHFRRNTARSRAERQAVWQKLADELDPEIALLLQMERSAKSIAEITAWLPPLLGFMSVVSLSVLRGTSGDAIAWSVHGTK